MDLKDNYNKFIQRTDLTYFEEKSWGYAVVCHKEANHKYGEENMPYGYHLAHVREVSERFKHLIPVELQEDVFSACWCHDLIEDARQTYNDVKKATNERVAEIVYAVTLPKGKNRRERNSLEYYTGIQCCQGALFVKLCDRIANMEYSKYRGSSMFEMYAKEYDRFKTILYHAKYAEMFYEIEEMISKETHHTSK